MNNNDQPFEFHNLIGRPAGFFLRTGAKFLPGVRKVQNQIGPYAASWRQHNVQAAATDAPLWVVLGDSMAQGIGASAHNRGWVGQLDDQLRKHGKTYRIINLSISGARIEEVIQRQLPALQALGVQPDLLTVMVGSNDLVRKKHRVNALQHFDELLEQLPPDSIVANLLGSNEVPIAMDARLQRAVRERGLILADVRQHAGGSWRGKVAEDHFHPNEKGYRLLADAFARAIL